MSIVKRCISFLLAAIMMSSLLPVSVFAFQETDISAAETGNVSTEQEHSCEAEAPADGTEESVSMLQTSGDASASGSCGDDLTWDIVNGRLSITGTGDMDDWSRADLVPWADYIDDITIVSLPYGLTSIGDCAFSGCKGLTDLSIPATVTEIGESAFSKCNGLTTVYIPDNVTVLGASAFLACYNLTSVTLSPKLTRIENYTFYQCEKLQGISIPESVTVIGASAFGYCYAIGDVYFHGAAPSIASNAFYETWADVYYSGDASWAEAAHKSYGGSLRWICISCGPNLTWKVVDTKLIIEGTGDMDDWDIGEVTQWPPWNEEIASKITEIEIGEGVTSIGDHAFWGFESLTDMVIPESVTQIGVFAFAGCSALTSVNLPESVVNIGEGAFSSCGKMTSIRIPSGVTAIEVYTFANSSTLASVIIPQGVTTVGWNAFMYCTGLESVIFTGDAPSFNYKAFDGVTANVYYPAGNETWTEEVRQNYMGDLTWISYDSLEDLIIASGELGAKYAGDILWSLSAEGMLVLESGETYGVKMQDYELHTVLPWDDYNCYVKDLKLRKIDHVGAYAFDGFYALEKANLEGAETIGDGAFMFCSALENVFIWGGYYDCVIGHDAFASCTALEWAAFPSDKTTISDYAFRNCTALKDVYIYNHADWRVDSGLTASDSSFYGVTAAVHLPAGWSMPVNGYSSYGGKLTWGYSNFGFIGPEVWWEYDADAGTVNITGTGPIVQMRSGSCYPWYGLVQDVTHVEIGDGITHIPEYTFEYMEKIQTVRLPDTLTTLWLNAFNDCYNLNNLLIPASVAAITGSGGTPAFHRCSGLTDVYYLGTAEEWAFVEGNGYVTGPHNVNPITLHTLMFQEGKPATCTEEGYEGSYRFDDTSVYDNCYDLNRQPIAAPAVIPATGHSWVEATCTQSRYCSGCFEEQGEALGHDLSIWEVIKAPTETENGIKRRTCSRCDYYEESEIRAAGDDRKTYFTEEEWEVLKLVNKERHAQGLHPLTGFDLLQQVGDLRSPELVELFSHTRPDGRDCYSAYDEVGLDYWWAGENIAAGYYDAYDVMDGWMNSSGHRANILKPDYDSVGLGYHYESNTTYRYYWTQNFRGMNGTFTDYQVVIPGDGPFPAGTELDEMDIYLVLQYSEDAFSHYLPLTQELVSSITVEDQSMTVAFELLGLSGSFTVELEHAHDYTTVITAPTCTEEGYVTYTCTVCGESYVGDYTDALGHDLGEWKMVKAPTCTEDGTERRVCSRCDYQEERIAEATGHDYTSEITAPTCTEKGFTTYTCACGAIFVADYVEALGHDMGEWKTVKAPTCTEDGMESRSCSRCDYSETRVIEATGHSFGEWFVNRAATCTEDGENRRNCQNCSYYETEVIPSTGHDYEAVVTDPTCTEKGFTTHTCRCGDSYVDTYVDALGHDLGTWETIVKATCTEDGSERRVCSRCDHRETRTVAATGHDYETVVTAPTCTEKGYTTHTCHCGDSYADSYTDPLGHDWDDGVVTVEPTEETEGEMTYTCQRCADTKKEVIPALDHVHNYEAVVTAPTCAEKGYTTHTCRCGDSYVDTYVDALGHDLGAWETIVKATCTEEGSERRDCSRCDHRETRTVAATGHDYEAVVTAPTCTEKGYATHTCHCGDSYVDSYTDPLGHDWDDGVVTVEPTEETEGEMTYTCLRCADTKTEAIPALDHVHNYEAVVTAPTCAEKGYTTHTCRCGDSYVDTYVDALGHDLGTWETIVKATCTEDGSERRVCSRCDHSETRTIAATGHDYEAVVTAPTCTEKGYTTHTCHCGDSYADSYTDPLGHDWDDGVVTVEPTEETEGEMTYTCNRCAGTKTEVLPALGHEHRYEAVVTAPTCTEKGYTTHTCRCGDSYVDTYVDALGHDLGAWETIVKATCTEDGSERRVCSRCDHSETRTVAATGHDYEAVVTSPTCTEKGYATHTCHCGDSYADNYTDPLGHDWDDGVVTVEPTEDMAGEKLYTCQRCADTKTEAIPALDHVHNYEAVVTLPTCTEDGYTTYTCSCGDSYVADYVDARGHLWSEWLVLQEPSITSEGLKIRTCFFCPAEETEVIPRLDHTHEYTAVVTAPSCTEGGYTTYTCECGESYVADYTDPLGHNWGAWEVWIEPTCTEEGGACRDCQNCGDRESRPVPALGHDYADGICTRCGEEDPDYEKPAENPFTDVPEGGFFYEPVMWAIANGITNGTSATTFGPNDQCMRAHVVSFLWRAAGSPEPESYSNPFADVKETDFYYKAVLWAVEKGITNGLDAAHFGPLTYCNRAQVVTFLWRAQGNPEPAGSDMPFTDVAPGAWYEKPILWAVENGITNGMSADSFGINVICNRAQIVTFLYRTYN